MKREPIGSVIKGVDKLFVTEESTSTDDTPSSETSGITETAVSVESKSEPSVNVSTNISSIPKKAKYLETRVQRSYYLDRELVKELDKYAKKNDYDKSDIINWILKEYLSKVGKI